MRDSDQHIDEAVHPHARLVAKRLQLPEARLAYLDDPDEIEELAEILVRRRDQTHRRHLRVYWALFYGGTGILLAAGFLINVVLIAVAVLWLILLAAVGLLVLKPAE